MFVVVFLTITFMQFHLKVLFHFHVIYTKKKNVGYTFTLCTIDCFIYACHACVFTLIKVKRFDEFYVKTVIVGYLTRISQECKTQPERLFGI